MDILGSSGSLGYVETDADSPTTFISNCPAWAQRLRDAKKGLVFVGDNYAYGLLGDASLLDVGALEKAVQEEFKAAGGQGKAPGMMSKTSVDMKVGKSTTKVPASMFNATNLVSKQVVLKTLAALGAVKIVP
eukprot:EC714811.1.p2 GENE.EC714811.1~~EC714811.1.p2  ORF type:complete len:132 (+),score=52.26 EC714811.1:3-398(+)